MARAHGEDGMNGVEGKSKITTLIVCLFMIGMGVAPAHSMIGKVLEAASLTYGVIGLIRDRVFWFLDD